MEQKQSKVFLVTGNEEIRNKNLFLENLLIHKKLKGENPLLIDLIPNNNCFMSEQKDSKTKPLSSNFHELHTDLQIPVVNTNSLAAILKGKNRDQVIGYENLFTSTFILGAFPQETARFYDCIDHLIFIIRNESETSSYLFSFINNLYDKMIEKNMSIIVSGVKRLEEAAKFFLMLRDEMKEMIDKTLVFDFIGSFMVDISKVTFSVKRHLAYIQVFEDDPFHGCIKYINEKLLGLEYFKTGSFFREIANSQVNLKK